MCIYEACVYALYSYVYVCRCVSVCVSGKEKERERVFYCTGDWGCITAAPLILYREYARLILYREYARFTAAAQLYCDRGATVLLARSSRTGSSAVHEARLY